MLTFEQYEKTVVETGIYHDSISRYVDSLSIPDETNRQRLHKLLSTLYCTLGLIGEAGEIAEKMKKIIRDKSCEISEEDKDLLIKEDGDVVWYTGALAQEFDSTLEKVAEANIEKLMSRKARGVIGGSGDKR
jgi:NTP pyrophosphatase (non-canonical NTP hydrolase)